MRPIIDVPASRTSIITLYNASDILQDLKFVSSENKRKNLQNVTKDSEIIMRRKEDGKTIQFKVVDNVSKLNREDWDRV
jgi:parafibromin